MIRHWHTATENEARKKQWLYNSTYTEKLLYELDRGAVCFSSIFFFFFALKSFVDFGYHIQLMAASISNAYMSFVLYQTAYICK